MLLGRLRGVGCLLGWKSGRGLLLLSGLLLLALACQLGWNSGRGLLLLLTGGLIPELACVYVHVCASALARVHIHVSLDLPLLMSLGLLLLVTPAIVSYLCHHLALVHIHVPLDMTPLVVSSTWVALVDHAIPMHPLGAQLLLPFPAILNRVLPLSMSGICCQCELPTVPTINLCLLLSLSR